jgi:hypothetical protein
VNVTPETRLKEALDLNPEVVDYVVSLNPHDFGRLRNPVMRRLMASRITLGRVAVMAGVPVRDLLQNVAELGGVEVGETGEGRPLPRSPRERPRWMGGVGPESVPVVDLLPLDDALDGDPMPCVVRGVKSLAPGEVLLIRHRWEPQPFYDVWTKMGSLEWFAERASGSEWWIWVRRVTDGTG